MANILTMREFTTYSDFETAERIALQQGYGTNWAYTTSSHIPGLYLCALRLGQPNKVVVKTDEMGFIVVEVTEE